MSGTARLATLFREEIASRLGSPATPDGESDCEAILTDACARGRAGNQGISLSEPAFVRDLARIAARDGLTAAALAQLAIEDLYLACACRLRAPRAAMLLDLRHRAGIRKSIARVARSSDDVAEIEQQLIVNLLVGSPPAAPILEAYGGQAPLERWLHVVAHRSALTWQRKRQCETRVFEKAARQALLSAETPAEVRFLKARYHRDFAEALTEALQVLDERDHLILRWHFVDAVTVDRIGKMFGVTQPTASRWLAAAREKLLANVKARLRNRLGESSGEIASLAGLVASRLDSLLSESRDPQYMRRMNQRRMRSTRDR